MNGMSAWEPLRKRRVRKSAAGDWEERMRRYNGEETWVKVRPAEKEEQWFKLVGIALLVLASIAILFIAIMSVIGDGEGAGIEDRTGKSVGHHGATLALHRDVPTPAEGVARPC